MRPRRKCLEPNCQVIGVFIASRCPAHQREYNRHKWRAADKSSRYNYAFQQARQQALQLIATNGYVCARCGVAAPPHASFNLDHMPDGTLKPSHPKCNWIATTHTRTPNPNPHAGVPKRDDNKK